VKKVMNVITIVALVGCIGMFNVSISAAKDLKPSGFLDDYSGFEESEKIKGLYVKKNPRHSVGDYNKFLIDPIIVYFKPQGKFSKLNPKRLGVNPKRLAELTEFFEKEIARALDEKYTVVNKPGEGVLRLRIAVTEIKANLPILNIYGYQTITGIGMGSASFEGEAIDSVTNEQVLAVVDSRKGRVLPKKGGAGDMAKEAFNNKMDSLTKYATIKQIMTDWADRFAAKVDEAHAY